MAQVCSFKTGCFVPTRRLEDRVRELCSKAVKARNAEFDAALSELRAALREHSSRLRKMAAAKLLHKEVTPDRRG